MLGELETASSSFQGFSMCEVTGGNDMARQVKRSYLRANLSARDSAGSPVHSILEAWGRTSAYEDACGQRRGWR